MSKFRCYLLNPAKTAEFLCFSNFIFFLILSQSSNTSRNIHTKTQSKKLYLLLSRFSRYLKNTDSLPSQTLEAAAERPLMSFVGEQVAPAQPTGPRDLFINDSVYSNQPALCLSL